MLCFKCSVQVRTLAMVKEMLFSIVLGPPEDDGDKRRERVDQRAMMLQFQQAVSMGKQDQYVLLSREVAGPTVTNIACKQLDSYQLSCAANVTCADTSLPVLTHHYLH